MAKPKIKDSKVTSFSLDVKVLDRLDDYCKTTYIPKTKVVELALERYLDEMEKKNPLFEKED
ncbi:MAG: ribbon-helix-helix domain-containing protein [Erysipelotrichaceae bacterium]|nr:ribbon-helix-helix domain-containing protein [Erysipelotrichaceae bacterium]